MIFLFFSVLHCNFSLICDTSSIHITKKNQQQHTTVIDKGIFNPTSSCGSKAIDIRKIKGNNNKK